MKTDNTITGEIKLFGERTRKRGYALNNEESIDSLFAVGTLIIKSDGSLYGALSVSGPAGRMKDNYHRVTRYGKRDRTEDDRMNRSNGNGACDSHIVKHVAGLGVRSVLWIGVQKAST